MWDCRRPGPCRRQCFICPEAHRGSLAATLSDMLPAASTEAVCRLLQERGLAGEAAAAPLAPAAAPAALSRSSAALCFLTRDEAAALAALETLLLRQGPPPSPPPILIAAAWRRLCLLVPLATCSALATSPACRRPQPPILPAQRSCALQGRGTLPAGPHRCNAAAPQRPAGTSAERLPPPGPPCHPLQRQPTGRWCSLAAAGAAGACSAVQQPGGAAAH